MPGPEAENGTRRLSGYQAAQAATCSFALTLAHAAVKGSVNSNAMLTGCIEGA
jgi:hypothetical protein